MYSYYEITKYGNDGTALYHGYAKSYTKYGAGMIVDCWESAAKIERVITGLKTIALKNAEII